MRSAYTQFIKSKGIRADDAVEQARALRQEEITLRLARIQNGVHPDYVNGHPKAAEKGTLTRKKK